MQRRVCLVASPLLALLLVAGFCVVGCGDDETTKPDELTSSLSYRGHESDFDSNVLVTAYPNVLGTRLDDCQTCHKSGEVTDDRDRVSELNPCSYCHLIPYPDESIVSGAPENYSATLNPYGLDYMNAGRDLAAIRSIAGNDSDEDTFTNAVELGDLRYPGDAESKPGQPTLPRQTFNSSQLRAPAWHDQFLLMNSHKQQFDTYANYRGIKIKDLLELAGADLTSATSVTFIAPDGYAKDFPIEAIDTLYPSGLYYANLDPGSFTEPDQGFVQYPPADQLPEGLVDGGEIPGEQWMMIAYDRDGDIIETGYLDAVSGKMNGEGPYRLIVPQTTPGAPDRGSTYSPSGYSDGYDYDDNKDHNAGLCVRGIVAIRVNPIPEGYEEFDWKNGGWSLMLREELIVYGSGITAK